MGLLRKSLLYLTSLVVFMNSTHRTSIFAFLFRLVVINSVIRLQFVATVLGYTLDVVLELY